MEEGGGRNNSQSPLILGPIITTLNFCRLLTHVLRKISKSITHPCRFYSVKEFSKFVFFLEWLNSESAPQEGTLLTPRFAPALRSNGVTFSFDLRFTFSLFNLSSFQLFVFSSFQHGWGEILHHRKFDTTHVGRQFETKSVKCLFHVWSSEDFVQKCLCWW